MFRLLGFPVHVRPGFVMFMVLIIVLYGDVFGLWSFGSFGQAGDLVDQQAVEALGQDVGQ